MHTLSGLPRTGIVERGADRGGIRERRVFPGLRRWPPGRRTRVDAARDRGQPRRAHSAAGVRPGRVHPGRRAADLLELTRRDSLTAAGTVHIVSKQQYPERRRGFWPCDAPGNLVACRQGANASPATGTIRVEPSKLRRADPSLWRGVSFLAPGRHGQSPPAREEHMALPLPDPIFDAEPTRRLYPNLSLFEGFPYLVTRVVPAMYHLIPVAGDGKRARAGPPGPNAVARQPARDLPRHRRGPRVVHQRRRPRRAGADPAARRHPRHWTPQARQIVG